MEVNVRGRAWMDREWSSQPLAPDQKGWDWFSLHFDTGEKLMLFQIRQEDGKPYRTGTWISPEGQTQTLGPNDILLDPVDHSAIAGRKLPTRWTLKIKSRGLDIECAPLNPQSWMGTSFPYWEGPNPRQRQSSRARIFGDDGLLTPVASGLQNSFVIGLLRLGTLQQAAGFEITCLPSRMAPLPQVGMAA